MTVVPEVKIKYTYTFTDAHKVTWAWLHKRQPWDNLHTAAQINNRTRFPVEGSLWRGIV